MTITAVPFVTTLSMGFVTTIVAPPFICAPTISVLGPQSLIATLPAITGNLHGREERFIQIRASLPGITGLMYGGGSIKKNLPAITMFAIGKRGLVGRIAARLPMIEIEMERGGFLDSSLPAITGAMSGTYSLVNITGSLASELPPIRMKGYGGVNES